MKLSKFSFDLPENLIAKWPSDHRDESRLMVVHKDTGKIEHRQFKDVIDYFEEGDRMVLNDTRVFPARIFSKKEKTGAEIEVFLLRELDKQTRLWDVLVEPARKIRIGNKLYFDEEETLVAEVIDNTTSRGRTIRFLCDTSYENFRTKLHSLGEPPLPKYINRPLDKLDYERYQTIFAEKEGAVAAPSAGLHFSKHLMKRLEIKGIDFSKVTLHVGLGTFRPVEVEDLSKHKMDSEEYFISEKTAREINETKRNKRKVCAVGTTVCRSLESSLTSARELTASEGWTNKFIFPPYEFGIPNAMITNLHLPKSTLLVMVAAFMGYELTMKVYKEAVKKKYRFYSYGDAMLII